MADLALLTARAGDHALTHVLPALDLLPHRVRVLPADPAALLREPDPDLTLVDATTDLAGARSTVRTLAAMELSCPVVGVFAEGGLAAVDAQWPLQDLVLDRAGPAEVEARIRLAIARGPAAGDAEGTRERDRGPLRVADVVVDEDSWIVRAGGEPLDLTFKEFELLRYLLLHAGRVVTREQLLQEVWGVDYYGGTRTVDVHVRRLRAKLGSERESLISTIRHVGYRFAAHPGGADDDVVQ